jgi:short-subunit dehydrogenase
VAKLFAARGADVALFARRAEVLEQAAAEVSAARASEKQRVAWKAVDVSRHEHVSVVMAQAVSESGAPDVLVNCAGRAIPRRFEDVTHEQFDETMRINLYGVWNVTAALVPAMRARRGGAIVNVSSMVGFLGVYGYTDYAASKFAVVGFSEALRSELQPHGITVSVLCPPDTDTPGFREENRTKPEETKAISAGARLMHPDDVARAMLRGMEKGRFLIVPGFDGKAVWLAKRFAPRLVERVMDGKIRRVRAGRGGRS